jgi:hypothetical protein
VHMDMGARGSRSCGISNPTDIKKIRSGFVFAKFNLTRPPFFFFFFGHAFSGVKK